MKNSINKRIKIRLENLGGNVNYERLFKALSLILSEDDLMKCLSSTHNNILSPSFDEYNEESEISVENLANS